MPFHRLPSPSIAFHTFDCRGSHQVKGELRLVPSDGKSEWLQVSACMQSSGCISRHISYFLPNRLLLQALHDSVEQAVVQGPEEGRGQGCIALEMCTRLDFSRVNATWQHACHLSMHAISLLPLF